MQDCSLTQIEDQATKKAYSQKKPLQQAEMQSYIKEEHRELTQFSRAMLKLVSNRNLQSPQGQLHLHMSGSWSDCGSRNVYVTREIVFLGIVDLGRIHFYQDN
ncbi:hypothetical protein P5673_025526 [Acropora cervicornis]|uniref:Uncharacterized protein n=1 Tax=Acropora cervicornis TaxID=6130 RepID=A0AAD9Q1S1_ACRCE|nr:hypothetical protein P5673_025526 [Acropora cervicornis]